MTQPNPYTKKQNFKYDHSKFNTLISKYGAQQIAHPNVDLSVKYSDQTYRGPERLITAPSKANGAPLVHNNMVPFYGGNAKQSTVIDSRPLNDTLDLYTGNFRLNQEHKQEVKKFFSPAPQHIIKSNIQARPTDLFSKSLTKRHGESPIEQVRVAPGLNQGYTDKGAGGFHQEAVVRIMPLTSEQEQVNPKTTFTGVVIAGADPVQKGEARPNLHVYKPHDYVHNENGERNFTTVGDTVAPAHYPEYFSISDNRKNITFQTGHAKDQSAEKHLPCNMQAKNKISTKLNLANTPFRSAFSGRGKSNAHNGYINSENDNHHEIDNRQQHHDKSGRTYGNATGDTLPMVYNLQGARETRAEHLIDGKLGNVYGGSSSIVYDPATITPDTTIKETTERNDHTGNAGQLAYAGKTYNKTEIAPETTVKETTINNLHAGNIITGHNGKTYVVSEITPDTTTRETTEQAKDYAGTVTLSNKGLVYDPSLRARNTVKETTIDNKHSGNIITGHNGKVYVLTEITPETTTRETTEQSKKYAGTVTLSNKGLVYDPSLKARNTVKETTENNEYIAPATSVQGHKAHDPNDIARITQRINTEKIEYFGGVNAGVVQNGCGYETAPLDINETQRQNYSDYYYSGNAGPAEGQERPRIYDDAYGMRQNVVREVVAQGREPTKVSVPIVRGNDTINLEVKKLDSDRANYFIHPSSLISNTRKPINTAEVTHFKNELPSRNQRWDPNILEAFNRNPLTQSLHSWA